MPTTEHECIVCEEICNCLSGNNCTACDGCWYGFFDALDYDIDNLCHNEPKTRPERMLKP